VQRMHVAPYGLGNLHIAISTVTSEFAHSYFDCAARWRVVNICVGLLGAWNLGAYGGT